MEKEEKIIIKFYSMKANFIVLTKQKFVSLLEELEKKSRLTQ